MDIKKNIAPLAMFLSLALICSYIESIIPLNFGVPGMKLGLTNVVIILVMYMFGPISAILISVLRILIAGFMFGNAFSIIYSLAGGLLSFLVMYLLKKFTSLKILSISVTGGIFHNIGQLIIAVFIFDSQYLIYYLPVLIIAGIITGALIGIIASIIYPRIKNIKH